MEVGGRSRERKDEPSVLMQSSIALLQERFKQLQRMKEKREEKEQVLLKKPRLQKEDPKQSSYSYSHDESPSGLLFFHFLPAVAVAHHLQVPRSSSLLPTVSETHCSMHVSKKRFHDWDLNDDHIHRVDTSLHL